MTITMKAVKDPMKVRAEHTINEPPGTKINTIPFGQTMEGEEDWIAPADGLNVKAKDRWVKVVKANGVPLPVPGWVAQVHMGQAYCNILSDTTPPVEPPTNPADVVKIVKSDVTFIAGDGSQKTTTLYPTE